MKKFLIIYPNWLPSNAVGVQRSRLIIDFIDKFGWEPILLTVKSKYLEEEKSFDLIKLEKSGIKIHYVDALPVNKKYRLFGDISLRAFPFLLIKSIKILKENNINIIWIPIPPFYTSLIGRIIKILYPNVKYGIDYIDPWVHDFPGKNRRFSRAWFSHYLSHIFEPIAVKKASFISGVSENYYKSVIIRNKSLSYIEHVAMPYGFNINDYTFKTTNTTLVWNYDSRVNYPYLYAGAFLPKSRYYFEILFKCLSHLKKSKSLKEGTHFYFLGTGSVVEDSITNLALKYGIEELITEITYRISYLEILNHLSNCYGVLVIGSVEQHYTASKIFQSILSKKPIFSVFHKASSVVKILKETNTADYLVEFDPLESHSKFEMDCLSVFENFMVGKNSWTPNFKALEIYSAENSASSLAKIFNKVSHTN